MTIDDVTVVIDTGRVKEMAHDPENGVSRLQETWASRAAAKQRRGRAGRVRPGVCFKLFSRKGEASTLPGCSWFGNSIVKFARSTHERVSKDDCSIQAQRIVCEAWLEEQAAQTREKRSIS